MGRPPGGTNADHEEKKEALARRVREAVLRLGREASLRDLARAADVSIPTLRHYFGDRSAVLAAALRSTEKDAAIYVSRIADPGTLELRDSLGKVARDLVAAWAPAGVGRVFAVGMSIGLYDDVAGPAYLQGILEPTVRAFEARLEVHARRGESRLDPSSELALRTAALAFVSPLLVALIHQFGLFGTTCRPLPMPAFIDELVDGFVRAYGPAPKKRRAR